jgi:hypothetical protein
VKDGIGREMAGQFGLPFRIPGNSQGSCTRRKSATWDRQLYFPSEGWHALDFTVCMCAVAVVFRKTYVERSASLSDVGFVAVGASQFVDPGHLVFDSWVIVSV